MPSSDTRLPSRGPSRHPEGCACTRCRGFQPGNRDGLRHGARSRLAIVPLVEDLRADLLERMGLHLDELTWLAAELLDGYIRAKAKVVAIDDWLAAGNPLVRSDGEPAGPMRLYFAALNTTLRALEALRGAIEAMSSAERDLAGALAALDAERARR